MAIASWRSIDPSLPDRVSGDLEEAQCSRRGALPGPDLLAPHDVAQQFSERNVDDRLGLPGGATCTFGGDSLTAT